MENNNQSKIAILIDAENVSYKNAKQIIETMETRGKIMIKTIVADWTKITGAKVKSEGKLAYRTAQIDGWRKEASRYSMSAVQQFSYVAQKNTSDIALSIQAMKILYEKPFITTFCLVSSDSDFTRLVQELREHDKEVIGMGDRGIVIQEFVNAFSEFVYLGESLEDEPIGEVVEEKVVTTEVKKEATTTKQAEAKVKNKQNNAKVETKQDTVTEVAEATTQEAQTTTKKKKKKSKKKKAVEVEECFLGAEKLNALKAIIENDIESSEESIAYYSSIAYRMKLQFPDFIPQNYECKKASQLIEKILPFLPEYVEHKEPVPNNENAYVMMLKRK